MNVARASRVLLCVQTLLLLLVLRDTWAAAGENETRNELEEVLQKREGSRVRLNCGVHSRKVVWTKDGVALGCAAGGCRAKLRLSNLTWRDSGTYQCWRPRGRLVLPSIVLEVTGRPRLEGPWPSNTSVVAGNTASLRCRVHSSLPLNIQWLRRLDNSSQCCSHSLSESANKTIQYEGDTYEVLSSAGEAAQKNDSFLSKLLLTHTSEEDSGFYICLATNNYGFRFRGAQVTILPRSPEGLIVPQGLLHVEVALILLVVLLVASPVLALTYLAYAHRQALLARKQPAQPAPTAL